MAQGREAAISPPASDTEERTVVLGGVASLEPVALESGALLASRYQIEARIGEGGSGQVFRAWDRVLGEPIALKILRPERAQEKTWIRRLAREVKVARAIRHPNVCRVFDLASADGHWFVSMELAAGGALRDTLRLNAGRPLAARIADARAICAGLAAIHAVGIIHRDVTPHNILRMADGRLVLSDFGLAVGGAETTQHGGTPSYMPPESAMGEKPDQRADVWQVGTILHELFYGRRPEWVQGAKGLTVRMPVGANSSPVERALARLCCDCLSTNPADRPASAIMVAARLAAAELAQPRGFVGRSIFGLWSWLRRHKRVTLAGATLLLLAASAALAVGLLGIEARALRPRSERVWDAEAREAAERALKKTGDPEAEAAFREIDRLFSKFLR